jgi:hypothetical protein
MKSMAQPDHEEITDADVVTQVTHPDQDEQPKEDTAKSEVQPGSKEQTDEDAVTPVIEPDNHDEPSKKNAATSWMRDIWSKVTKKG